MYVSRQKADGEVERLSCASQEDAEALAVEWMGMADTVAVRVTKRTSIAPIVAFGHWREGDETVH